MTIRVRPGASRPDIYFHMCGKEVNLTREDAKQIGPQNNRGTGEYVLQRLASGEFPSVKGEAVWLAGVFNEFLKSARPWHLVLFGTDTPVPSSADAERTWNQETIENARALAAWVRKNPLFDDAIHTVSVVPLELVVDKPLGATAVVRTALQRALTDVAPSFVDLAKNDGHVYLSLRGAKDLAAVVAAAVQEFVPSGLPLVEVEPGHGEGRAGRSSRYLPRTARVGPDGPLQAAFHDLALGFGRSDLAAFIGSVTEDDVA